MNWNGGGTTSPREDGGATTPGAAAALVTGSGRQGDMGAVLPRAAAPAEAVVCARRAAPGRRGTEVVARYWALAAAKLGWKPDETPRAAPVTARAKAGGAGTPAAAAADRWAAVATFRQCPAAKPPCVPVTTASWHDAVHRHVTLRARKLLI